MTLPTPPTPDALAQAAPLIEASLERSPCGSALFDVMTALAEGDAQLWLDGDSAVVSQFMQEAYLVLSERVWHAGGDWQGVRDIIEKGSEVCAKAGLDRIIIEDTRKGWAKRLAPLGFKQKIVLVKEL